MESFSELIDALYERFLLVDVFGKIVPGFLVLYAGVLTLWSQTAALTVVVQLGPWSWAFVFGACWTLAFAVQRFGQAIGLVHDVPDLRTWYERRAAFQRLADKGEVTQLSRLLAIKDVCGNGCTAVLVALAIVLLGNPGGSWVWLRADLWRGFILILLSCAVIFYLRRIGAEHVDRAGQYVDAVVSDRSAAASSRRRGG